MHPVTLGEYGLRCVGQRDSNPREVEYWLGLAPWSHSPSLSSINHRPGSVMARVVLKLSEKSSGIQKFFCLEGAKPRNLFLRS